MGSFPNIDTLDTYLPTLEIADEFSKNLALARFIHLCEQKTLEVDFFQKRLIKRAIEEAQLKFTNAALKEYYLKRAAYKVQVLQKGNRARPEEYVYAVSANPLSLTHLSDLIKMRASFLQMACGTLVGEMRIAILYSYLAWKNLDGITSSLKDLPDNVKTTFWTIIEESYFDRNEIAPLSLNKLIKIRELYESLEGARIFFSKLSENELFEGYAYIEELAESPFKTLCKTAIFARHNKIKIH